MIFRRRGDAAVGAAAVSVLLQGGVHAETAKVRDQVSNLSVGVNALPSEPQRLLTRAKKLGKASCAYMSLL